MDGLMTVNKAIEKIRNSILGNNDIQTIIQIRKVKLQAENLILYEKTNTKEFENYRVELSGNKESKSIVNILNHRKDLIRLFKILQKIQKHEKYANNEEIHMILDIIDTAFNFALTGDILMYVKSEQKAMKNKNYPDFIHFFQEEKQLLFVKFSDKLNSLAPNTFKEEFIRAAFTGKMGFSPGEDAFRQLINKYSNGNLQEGNLGMRIVNLLSFLCTLPLIIMTSSLPQDIKTRNYLRKNHAEHNKDEELSAKRLEKQFGFKLKGYYAMEDLHILLNALGEFTPFEIKRKVKEVLYLPKSHDELFKSNSKAYYNFASHRLVLYRGADMKTIVHEVAHPMQIGSSPALKSNFLHLSEKYYKKWKKYVTKDMLWKNKLLAGPKFGFVSPYSMTDPSEDIAEFRAGMMSVYEKRRIRGRKFDEFISPYLQTYRRKAELLLTFSQVSREVYQYFINFLLSFDVQET